MTIDMFLKFFRELLKLAGAFGLALAVLVAAGIYQNHRAEQKAAEFCESVANGARLSDLISKADQLSVRHYQNNYSDQHQFMFPGMVFNWSHCIVKTKDGSVTLKWTTPAQD